MIGHDADTSQRVVVLVYDFAVYPCRGRRSGDRLDAVHADG